MKVINSDKETYTVNKYYKTEISNEKLEIVELLESKTSDRLYLRVSFYYVFR